MKPLQIHADTDHAGMLAVTVKHDGDQILYRRISRLDLQPDLDTDKDPND
jgi:hypothetical protein